MQGQGLIFQCQNPFWTGHRQSRRGTKSTQGLLGTEHGHAGLRCRLRHHAILGLRIHPLL